MLSSPDPRVLGHLLRVLRLPAPGCSPLRADGRSRTVRVDPRLHRRGEDGPTHQPIEHLSALRAIPGFDVVRPADANETAVAWRTILEKSDRPAGIVLSRQNLPVWAREDVHADAEGEKFASAEGTARGGYIMLTPRVPRTSS